MGQRLQSGFTASPHSLSLAWCTRPSRRSVEMWALLSVEQRMWPSLSMLISLAALIVCSGQCAGVAQRGRVYLEGSKALALHQYSEHTEGRNWKERMKT